MPGMKAKLKVYFAKCALAATLALGVGITGASVACASGEINENAKACTQEAGDEEFGLLYASGNAGDVDSDQKGVKKVSITYKGSKLNSPISVKVRKTYQLKAVTAPKGQKVTWLTSNPKVASVSKSGKVTVKKAGNVKITAKAKNGKKASVKLKAARGAVKVKKLAITGRKSMRVKKSQKLGVTVSPATADNRSVRWNSSDKGTASVDSKGRVTARKKGTVRITASAKDGSGKKAVFTIRIK